MIKAGLKVFLSFFVNTFLLIAVFIAMLFLLLVGGFFRGGVG